MTAVPCHPEELEQALALVRKGPPPHATNFFVAPGRYAAFFRGGIVWLARGEGVAVFARVEKSCLRGFFACGSGELKNVADKFVPLSRQALAVDLLGRGPDAEKQARIFEEAGFARHETVLRLARGRVEDLGTSSTVDVTDATRDDAGPIERLLDSDFDPLADQLPDSESILEAVKERAIRVVRHAGRLAGFVWSEQTGATATIRYWAVDRSARGKGVGSALMRDYFTRLAGCPRHLIWVRSRNAVAAACYEHYGYRADGLVDIIMVKRNSP